MFHRDDTTGMIYLKCTLTLHTQFQHGHSGVHSFLPRSSTRSSWGCNIPRWLLETNESREVLKAAMQFGAELSAGAETFTEEVPTSNTVQLRESQGNYWALPQKHRTDGVGKGLWKSSSPTPLLRQGHQEQVAQDSVQQGCTISKLAERTLCPLLTNFLLHCRVLLRICTATNSTAYASHYISLQKPRFLKKKKKNETSWNLEWR